MPFETIGTCGISRGDWRLSEMELGMCYIRQVCGEPPDGYELEIVDQDHDLGSYSMIGLTWDDYGDAPWDYLRRAEEALLQFQDAVDWAAILPASLVDDDDPEDLDEDETSGD